MTNDGALSAKLIFIAATAALGGFLFGYDSSIINGTVDAVRGQFGPSPTMIGFTLSSALLGAIVGAWYADIFAGWVRRVRTMKIASALLSVKMNNILERYLRRFFSKSPSCDSTKDVWIWW